MKSNKRRLLLSLLFVFSFIFIIETPASAAMSANSSAHPIPLITVFPSTRVGFLEKPSVAPVIKLSKTWKNSYQRYRMYDGAHRKVTS